MESGSARPCACAWKIFPTLRAPHIWAPFAPNLLGKAAWELRAAERGARFVESVAFLCFMDNFFLLFLPITDRPSLGQILFMILEEEVVVEREGGGGGVSTVSCSRILRKLSGARCKLGRCKARNVKIQRFVCASRGRNAALRVGAVLRVAHLDARFKTWSGYVWTPCGQRNASCTFVGCYRGVLGLWGGGFSRCRRVCAAYRLLCNLTSRQDCAEGLGSGQERLAERTQRSRRRIGRSHRCMAEKKRVREQVQIQQSSRSTWTGFAGTHGRVEHGEGTRCSRHFPATVPL